MTEICRPDDRYAMVLCTVTEIDSRYDVDYTELWTSNLKLS